LKNGESEITLTCLNKEIKIGLGLGLGLGLGRDKNEREFLIASHHTILLEHPTNFSSYPIWIL